MKAAARGRFGPYPAYKDSGVEWLGKIPALPPARARPAAARRCAPARSGRRYLIQHSAGRGKTYTIAWLVHQLSTLHDASDRRDFDSIVVVTDRRVIDRQLQRSIRQFEQTLGVVENIDRTARQHGHAQAQDARAVRHPRAGRPHRALPRLRLDLGPEHRVTLGQMMDKLAGDTALEAAARVNTPENLRLAFDRKVEHVIQDIVDSNFELFKRITDDRAFGEALKNFLFDEFLRAHRGAGSSGGPGGPETPGRAGAEPSGSGQPDTEDDRRRGDT